MSGGRRILALLALGAVGTLAALSISTSLALFGATAGQQTDSFAAGTVTLLSCASDGSTACTPSVTSTAATIATPFQCKLDKSNPTCEYTINYEGSLPAWIWLDVTVGSQSRSSVTVCDNKTSTYYQVDSSHQLVGTTPAPGWTSTSDTLPWTHTFVVSLGSGTTNTVSIEAHAVQSDNNTLNSGNGPVSWS